MTVKSKPALLAKEIRKELKAKFPKTKFSVRSQSYSGGGSVRVEWTDFPTIEAVEAVVNNYQKVDRDEATGEILLGANYFVNTTQNLSPELKAEVNQKLPEDIDHWAVYHHQRKILKDMYKEVRSDYEYPVEPTAAETKPKKEVAEQNKSKPATKRQLYALHCETKLDTRNLDITRQQAHDLIARSKDGQDVSSEIIQ